MKRIISANAMQYSLSLFGGLLTCAFIFALQTTADARPGDLDPTFGTNGTVLAPIADTGGNFFTGGSVLQTDGKIIVAGQIDANGKTNCGAARFNADGSLDTSFATNGRFIFLPFQIGSCRSPAIALQPDGKILLGGNTFTPSPDNSSGGDDAILIRLNANGTLDSSFGTNGFLVTFTGTPESRFGFGGGRGHGAGFITSIQVQTDGKIIAVGYANSTQPSSRTDMIVLRYNANGTRDTSFAAGDQANVRFDTALIYNVATTSALQSDGKILLAGYIIRNDTPSPLDSAIARLNADGSLDTSFGTGGKVLIDLGDGRGDNINSILILPNGKILAGGSVASNVQSFTLARFNVNGALDSTFGTGGKIITTVSTSSGIGLNRILLQPDGKIIAGGGAADWLVERYNSDGSLDSSFGIGGVSSFRVRTPNINSQCNNILLQPDGKIVATGNGQSNDVNGSQAGLARLLNKNVRSDFDGDGKVDVSVYRNSEGTWYLNRSREGFTAIHWGAPGGTDILVPGDYDNDGKTDFAIFRPDANPANPDYWVLNSNGFTFSGVSWGVPGDIPVVGDYDGDGITDFAIFRPSNGTWYIIYSSGVGPQQQQFGLNGDIPLAMDPDGDGKTNLAVFRPGNNTWYIAKPTGIPAQNFDSIQFGQSGDKLVPADYDGDGKTDIAIFRPSNGTWYIISTKAALVNIIKFGQAGDIPVPGDYDGDGTDDIAVYRGGLWYILKSKTGSVDYIQFGVSTDKPIPSVFTRDVP